MSGSTVSMNQISKLLYLIGGSLALAVGIAGIILPLVPTTPLVLLAAFCFARSSKRLHQWILSHRLFGQIIRDWEQYRGIRASIRRKAYLMIVVCFSISIAVAPVEWVRYLLAGMCAVLLFYMSRLPVVPEESAETRRVQQFDQVS